MFHFFAYLSRLKHITRWNLMRNVRHENVMEHTCEVAMIAHGLALIANTRYGEVLDPQRTAVLALYHEVSEVITGDLVTPVKYFNAEITGAFKQIEAIAQDRYRITSVAQAQKNDAAIRYYIDQLRSRGAWPDAFDLM